MTSDTSVARSGTTRSGRTNGGDPSGNDEAIQVAMREVRNAIRGVGRSMPEVARVSRGAVDDLIRTIETGSDQQVTAGVSLSLGLAIGMLLGGAPRLLILLALAPVAVMGLALADRRPVHGRSSTSSS
jgi:hypothetical protein